MAYWLLKSEPHAYSWDDLVRDGVTGWTGVRNAAAALNLKAMGEGDLALFYHSNIGKECVGVARITRTAYPDPTDASGRHPAVDIAPVRPFARPVTLKQLKADPRFAAMALVRLSRLSVGPVTADEWAAIEALAAA